MSRPYDDVARLMPHLAYQVDVGDDLERVARAVVAIARERSAIVTFIADGIELRAAPDTTYEQLASAFAAAKSARTNAEPASRILRAGSLRPI